MQLDTMNAEDFEDRLRELRPRLHRYCARMTGSAVPLLDDLEDVPLPEADIVAVGFQTFLQLPELQRCAVILKDVLGHSIEEIADISGCTQAAAKSALQRGRGALRQLAERPEDVRLPLLSDANRLKMASFVRLFQGGDFDQIRAMLAEDVKLELVNRLKLEGREGIGRYFTRYAQEARWRFALGAIEGRPAMLVFDSTDAVEKPAHFVILDWHGDEIAMIRDFLFAPYVLESVDWARLA